MSNFISTIHEASDPVAYLRALLAEEPVVLLSRAIFWSHSFTKAEEMAEEIHKLAGYSRYMGEIVGVSSQYEEARVLPQKVIDEAYDVIAEIGPSLVHAERYAWIQWDHMKDLYLSSQIECAECVIAHRLFDGRPGLLDTLDAAAGELVRNGVREIAVDVSYPTTLDCGCVSGLFDNTCYTLEECIDDYHIDLVEAPEYAEQWKWLAVFDEYDANKWQSQRPARWAQALFL